MNRVNFGFYKLTVEGLYNFILICDVARNTNHVF